ncbi:Long-chain-fatty-acid--CoA ligase [Minicystis rosea]|nr:Long-chain-fatty-acid--CoA ligase [Minicystis rosea]
MIGPRTAREVASFFERCVDAGHERLDEQPFDALAERWHALGLRPGDLVLLSLPTGVALLQHFFGVMAAGGVPALLAPGMPSQRLRELGMVMGARAVGAVRLPAGLDPERVDHVGLIEVAWARDARKPATQPGEVVLLTSGTSGSASGCVTSLEAMLRNGARHADAIGQRADDTVLISLPLYFSFALVAQALGTFGRGGRLVIAGPPFQQDAYAKLIASQGVTVSALSPTQARTLLAHDATLPRSLRTLGVGGDSLAPEHVAELLRKRPSGELYLTYGLTQAGPRVSTLAAHAEPSSRYTSVGLPLAGTKVWLEDLGDGSGRTELIVSSDTVMRRRIGLVEGRAHDDLRAPDVLATGDVFEQDESGYLFYRGRLSEYILRSGEKVCVATVRRLATRIPGVVTARTRLKRGADGEDYDLALVISSAVSGDHRSPDHYRAMLAKSVRRAELPHTIEIIADYEAHALGYK